MTPEQQERLKPRLDLPLGSDGIERERKHTGTNSVATSLSQFPKQL